MHHNKLPMTKFPVFLLLISKLKQKVFKWDDRTQLRCDYIKTVILVANELSNHDILTTSGIIEARMYLVPIRFIKFHSATFFLVTT